MSLRRWLSHCTRVLTLALVSATPGSVRAEEIPRVILVSIDGMSPDLVFDADRLGLRIPTLRMLLREGAHARRVKPVFPTVTCPNHASLVTGVSPSRHGVTNNYPLGASPRFEDSWCWNADEIRARTLWDALSERRRVTASVHWPSTVGGPIDFPIVAHRQRGTDGVRAGFIEQATHEPGELPAAHDFSAAADARRAEYAAYIFERERPSLLALHLGALDLQRHRDGRVSPAVFEVLERLDSVLGSVVERARRIAPRTVIVVVSDHGFADCRHSIRINYALKRAGLLSDGGKSKTGSRRALAWPAGGSAAIVLSDPGDDAALQAVLRAVEPLRKGADSPIEKVLAGKEISATNGFPGAALVLIARRGYRFESGAVPPLVAPSRKNKGTHGYPPDRPDMDAVFFAAGPGIPRGKNLGDIQILDVAPTLAGLLRVNLPGTEGRDMFANLRDDDDAGDDGRSTAKQAPSP